MLSARQKRRHDGGVGRGVLERLLVSLPPALLLTVLSVGQAAGEQTVEPERDSGACTLSADGTKGGLPLGGDGWPLSSPAAEGIDPEALAAMAAAIDAGDYTKVDSILIARHGRLVFEAYFNDFGADSLHDTRSAFKSVTSILIGIAIDRGLIDDVGAPILPLFSRYQEIENWSEDKKAITLEHLLTMTPGFDAEENFGVGPWREDDMWRSRDWMKFTLDLPMAYQPGAQFAYNTPTSVLLGGVLRQASGEPVADFARKVLFEPLCISDYRWSFSPSGQAMTGGSFFIRPRDLAKFGQLFLDRGVWNGQRLVSEEWVERSTKRRVASLPPGSPKPPALEEVGYGYHWWTYRALGGTERTSAFFASGNGGQLVFVFPELDLVVVFTGSHYNDARGHRQPLDILRYFILPAVAT